MTDYFQWQADFERQMKLKMQDAIWHTQEQIDLKPLYGPADLTQRKIQASYPGEAPFARGVYSSGYVGRPWTIRQYAGFSTAAESNAFYRENLRQGQQGISVAFDLPTHRGYDSDHPRVSGDVGKAGVAIDSVEDMKILFDQIPLDQVSVSMTMNGAVLPIMAFYLVAAQEQSSDWQQLRGTIQNDILKEFMVRNTYIYPPKPSLDIVQDIIGFCSKHLPKFNPVSISGYHMQEAGADAALELAYTLANGKQYVQAAMKTGLAVDQFAPRLSFFFGIGMHFLMEIAKLRAGRILWSEVMTELGAKQPKSKMLRVHCQTSGWSLTAQDPYNNVVRTTVEAMAAILGGTQSLHTNGFDEAVALPSVASARLARNTQLILQLETDLTKTIDPFGGSYMMESMTADLCTRVRELWKELDQAGSMVDAINAGIPQRRIARAAAERQSAIDQGQEPIVGVNCYKSGQTQDFDILAIDTSVVKREQNERLASLKANRDQGAVSAALAALREAAQQSTGQLLQSCVDCAQVRATLGEISAELEGVFGRHRSQPIQVSGVFNQTSQDSSEWQSLRSRVQAFSKRNGRRPRILIGKLGQDGHDRGAKVVAAGFVDLGFDVDLGPLFATPEEVVRQALDQDVHVIGISTLVGAHLPLVPELIQALREAGAQDMVVVCGGVIPEQDHQLLYEAGVAFIATPGTPVHVSATAVLAQLERIAAANMSDDF